MLVMIRNDRKELANVIDLINAYEPKLVCVNVDLYRCEQEKRQSLLQLQKDKGLSPDSPIYPSEDEKLLSGILAETLSLLMPSKIRLLGSDDYAEITGCGFLYSDDMSTGFVDLVFNKEITNQVEKVQLKTVDSFGDTLYHFAAKIAIALNAEKVKTFINGQNRPVNIDFNRERKFRIYTYDQLMNREIERKSISDKIVIVGIGQPEEQYLVRKSNANLTKELRRMSTSEIFANIAAQLVEN